MNLFIDTPQRAAERLQRERRSAAEDRRAAIACEGDSLAASIFAWDAPGPSEEPEAAAPSEARRPAPEDAQTRPDEQAEPLYSVAEDAYRAEKAYDRKRARKRKLAGALRMLAMAVLLPLAVVAVFLISYVLTCILNGASPDELVQLVAQLFSRVKGFVRDVVALL